MFAPTVVGEVFERLVRAGCVAAQEEAEDLLHAASDVPTLMSWVSRREEGEPLAWIIGGVEFLGHAVRVDEGVFVPRAQTFELARRSAELLPARGRAADLCTGSGAIAVHLAAARRRAAIVATDIDPRAVACARRNGVEAVVADLDRGLSGGAFDLVAAVVPYVPTDALRLLPYDVTRYEPRTALDGGPDGLDLVRRLVTGAARLLRPRGWLVAEIGGDQDAATASLLAEGGFGEPTFWRDNEGDLRGVAARRAAECGGRARPPRS